jgi:hypothetical protein
MFGIRMKLEPWGVKWDNNYLHISFQSKVMSVLNSKLKKKS